MKTLTRTLAAAAIAAFTFGFTPSAQAEDVAQVTIGGVTTPYATIEAAWTAVTNAGTKTTPATLTLLTDVTVTAMLKGPTNDDFSAIFDLNDKVVTVVEGNDVHIIHQHGKLSVVDSAANKTTKYFVPDEMAEGRWVRTDAVTERAVKGGYFTGYAWLLMLEGGDVEISDVSFVGAKRNPIFTQSVDDLIYGKCSFSRVNFLGNVCEDDFGGNPGAISLACKEFQYLFEDCVFRENVSPSFGGAIGRVVVSGEYSAPRLVRCVFENNRSLESDGGAVRLDAPGRSQLSGAVPVVNAMVFEDCVFGGNVAGGNGGAIAAYCNAQILLKNCVVTNNVAGGNGGGICMDGAELQQGSDPNDKFVLINTTITGNRASAQGGGVYFAQTKACLAAGTKVTMADGTEKAIEEVVEGDIVRTFDHEGGTNATARVYLAFKGETKELPFTLEFDTPSSNLQPSTSNLSLSIVGRHDLLEKASRKYVTISAANAHQYVGAEFYGADGQWHELTGVTRGTQAVDYYSLYTAQHQNAYANGMLTASDDVDHLLNIYELDENLKADAAQLAADIAQYGLATFEECSTKYGMSRSWYDDAGAKYNYVAIGKGLATLEGLEALFAASVSNADPFSDYDVGVLTLGANVVITNNTTGDGQSNVYLNYPKDGEGATHISFIALAADHTGICVGVTTVQTPTEGMDVQFTDYGATAGDTALFTSDEGYSVICREKALFLSVNPPVTPVEYREPVYNTAGDPKSGIDHWVTNSVSEYTVVSDQTEWGTAGETNWYVVAGDVTIADRITCLGDVRLILKDGAKLNAQAGITASTATEDYLGFTVYAQSEGETMGALVAIDNVPKRYAGIGGWYGSDQNKGFSGSNITINGGTVTAKGGENADGDSGAGIGGGASGIGSNIVVNGGTVAATGGQYSAGIGGGQETGGSDITINGGTVTAVGGGRSAGIGGGYGNTGSGITINGGTVTAVGDCGAAAIGGGLVSVGSDISIANATLYLASPALNYEDELVSADVIGSGFASEESSSGVTIDASAKVFFNLTGVQNLDGSWIEPISPMPASFDGFAIMTPETAVERVLVGGIANWTAGKTFNLVNAATAATGTITVKDEKGTVFANKLLKLPHADSTLTLTAEDPPTPTGIQVGDSVYAVLDETGKICTLVGTGETWDFKVCTNELAQVTNVVIGAGVTHIGSRFFKKAYNLQAVSGGADLASVGGSAFYLCTRLETIHLDCTAAPAGMADAVVVRTAVKPSGETYAIPDVKPGYKHVLFGKKALDDADWTDLGSPDGKTIYDYDGYRFFQLKLVEEL